jgi:divinyl chlorophyllide a 8-vinyl-reductase
VDYQATKNALDAARKAGAKHFVLLSAICVQKPLLEFQRAKLKLEAELQVRQTDRIRCWSSSG